MDNRIEEAEHRIEEHSIRIENQATMSDNNNDTIFEEIHKITTPTDMDKREE
jgi:hypothetical protein